MWRQAQRGAQGAHTHVCRHQQIEGGRWLQQQTGQSNIHSHDVYPSEPHYYHRYYDPRITNSEPPTHMNLPPIFITYLSSPLGIGIGIELSKQGHQSWGLQ